MQINDILNGSYRVLQPIGKGGMGTVYLAYHIRLEKYVVIKALPITAVKEQDLRTETDILKNLHHPNLPQVYDFFSDNTAVYTVMDYVEGVTLETYINERYPCSEELLQHWLEQLADVLNYLHSRTPPILHCDIKPGNIIITPAGDAVLIDFNVSLALGQGRLLGVSPRYASPEQMQMATDMVYGQLTENVLRPSTDVYSLAASFYHLMSGIQPSARQRPQPLQDLGLGYSEGLCRLLDQCLQFDPALRPADGKQLLRAVHRLRRFSCSP